MSVRRNVRIYSVGVYVEAFADLPDVYGEEARVYVKVLPNFSDFWV